MFILAKLTISVMFGCISIVACWRLLKIGIVVTKELFKRLEVAIRKLI